VSSNTSCAEGSTTRSYRRPARDPMAVSKSMHRNVCFTTALASGRARSTRFVTRLPLVLRPEMLPTVCSVVHSLQQGRRSATQLDVGCDVLSRGLSRDAAMRSRIEFYRAKAEQAETRALTAVSIKVGRQFAGLAREWRELESWLASQSRLSGLRAERIKQKSATELTGSRR
jgi:hypothetical protein